jgi:hypothetical protein
MHHGRSKVVKSLTAFRVAAGVLTAVPSVAKADATIHLTNADIHQCLDADARARSNTAPKE